MIRIDTTLLEGVAYKHKSNNDTKEMAGAARRRCSHAKFLMRHRNGGRSC